MLAFFDEDYAQAYQHLSGTLHRCHKASKANKRLILTYLIPLKVLHGVLVRTEPLYKYGLQAYTGLLQAVRIGHIENFDKVTNTAFHVFDAEQCVMTQALALLQQPLMKRNVYTLFEKLKIIAYRNLFKRAYALCASLSELDVLTAVADGFCWTRRRNCR